MGSNQSHAKLNNRWQVKENESRLMVNVWRRYLQINADSWNLWIKERERHPDNWGKVSAEEIDKPCCFLRYFRPALKTDWIWLCGNSKVLEKPSSSILLLMTPTIFRLCLSSKKIKQRKPTCCFYQQEWQRLANPSSQSHHITLLKCLS